MLVRTILPLLNRYLCRPEFKLDGINSGSWYHCLPIGIYHWLGEGGCIAVVRSSMLHRSETWPVRKENEVALQRAEMRTVKWMCNVKVKDRVPSKELREKLGIDDIILILQQNRLRWYGMCCEKKIMTGWRGRPKRTWSEVVQKDCQARNLNRKDAMDRGRWKKLIKTGWSGWWVGECFFWYRFTRVVLDKGL